MIDRCHDPDGAGVVELGGRRLAMWLPWHFDHCHKDGLNRAGVPRAIAVPPDGGLTGFAGGIPLYQALSPALREAIEGRRIRQCPRGRRGAGGPARPPRSTRA